MSNKVTVFAILCCFVGSSFTERPPETILASDSYKPDVKLSLLTPEHPHEGDEVQLECSAKPKNRSDVTKPVGVHWIKGNTGLPNSGTRPDAADRYVKETTENETGVVLFTLTIKDVEPTDADRYMCIVQVGQTGYFTSNELPIEIEPSLEKSSEETDTDEVEDIDEILKWKDRVLDLSQAELQKLANAMTKDEERKQAKIEAEKTTTTPQNDDLLSLTPEESKLLARKSEIEDMSESELMLLAQVMRKDKAIKTQQEEQQQERKRQEEETALKKKQEKEELKAKAEKKKKAKSDILTLNAEEKAILKRKDEIEDMAVEELQLLSAALKKERNIKLQDESNQQNAKKESKKELGDSDLTEEERDILKRKDEIRDMSPAELRIMSRALTKQKKIQDAKKRLDTKEETKTSTANLAGDDMTEEEMNAILSKKDKLMELTQDDLNLLTKALTKEKKLKAERRKQEGVNSSDDEMSEDAMREILKLREGDMSQLTQQEITMLGKALLKEQKMKKQKQNDLMENEEVSIKDEL